MTPATVAYWEVALGVRHHHHPPTPHMTVELAPVVAFPWGCRERRVVAVPLPPRVVDHHRHQAVAVALAAL